MAQKEYKRGSTSARMHRIEQVADLYFEGYSKEEIAEYADVSVRTIGRDIEYIEEHKMQFLN